MPTTRKEFHEPICKIGSYLCPLCEVSFKLNQPYGRHVRSQECVLAKADQERTIPVPEQLGMVFTKIDCSEKIGSSSFSQSHVSLARDFFP